MEDIVGFITFLGVITFIFALVTYESWMFFVYVLTCATCFGTVAHLAFH